MSALHLQTGPKQDQDECFRPTWPWWHPRFERSRFALRRPRLSRNSWANLVRADEIQRTTDGFLDASVLSLSLPDPQFAVPPTCMSAWLVFDGMSTRRYHATGKSLTSCRITAGPAVHYFKMYVPHRVALYGTRPWERVSGIAALCGSELASPVSGPPATTWATCQTQLYPGNGPKALEAHSFSLLKRPLPQPPIAGLGETAICLIVCRMNPGT